MTHEETQKMRDLWACYKFETASLKPVRKLILKLLDEILLRDDELLATRDELDKLNIKFWRERRCANDLA